MDLLRLSAELATLAVSSGEERSGDFAQLTKQSASFSHIRGRPCHGPIAIIFARDFSTSYFSMTLIHSSPIDTPSRSDSNVNFPIFPIHYLFCVQHRERSASRVMVEDV